jgi:DNA modification methylase
MGEIPDGSVDMVFTSPPYNLGISSGGGLKGGTKSGKWKNAKLAQGYKTYSDDMPYSAYVTWQKQVLTSCWNKLSDEDFKKAYTSIEAYLAAKGITIDPACKDIRRISFVSYDPNLFYNKNPQVFELNTQIELVDDGLYDLHDLYPLPQIKKIP